jgi:putative MATE family efflux protein
LIGADRREDASLAAGQVFLIIAVLGIFFASAGPWLSRVLFRLIGASPAMTPYIYAYTDVLLLFSVFQFSAMIGNGILRGEGNTITPMQVMIVGNLINLVLDPFLIFGLGPFPAMGVRGAAIATVAGRGASTLFLLFSLFKRDNIVKPRFHLKQIAWNHIRGIFGVGGPTLLANLANSLGLSLLYVLLRPYGDAVKATFTIGFTYQQIAFLPVLGVAQGVLTMTGQNWGARNVERIRRIARTAALVSILVLAIISLIIAAGAGGFISIFTSNPEMIAIGRTMLLLLCFGFPFMAVSRVLVSVFHGLGMGMRSLILTVSYVIVIVLPMALLGAHLFDLPGLWGGMALGHFMSGLLGYLWVTKVTRGLTAKG